MSIVLFSNDYAPKMLLSAAQGLTPFTLWAWKPLPSVVAAVLFSLSAKITWFVVKCRSVSDFLDLCFGIGSLSNPEMLKDTVLLRTLHWDTGMTLPIFTSLKQGKGTQAHFYVVSWSSCPWMQWRWSWKMAMALCLFILATILDMSLPQLETFVGVFLVTICVLVVSLGILKPTLMFLQYGGSSSLLFSPRSSSHFERW